MKKSINKIMALLGMSALGLGLLAGCGAQGATSASNSSSSENAGGSEIKIGFVAQLSGGGALYGKQMQQGAQLAVDEINEAGGVIGKKLKLISQDDQGNPSESVKVTQRLISEEKINAWMGTLKSSDTLTNLGITSKQNIPSFVPIAVADEITSSGFSNVYRNVADNTMQVKELVDYILNNRPDKKVALISENSDYGRGLAETFKMTFEQNGGQVLTSEFYNIGQKEFTDQLTKIRKTKPDAIVIGGLVAEGALISKQAQDLGLKYQLYSYGGFMGSAPIDLAGSAVNGLIHTEYFTPIEGDKKIEAFVNGYENKYGQKPDSYYSAATYDAVYLYAEGLKIANDLDPEKVNAALHTIKGFQGVMGSITFDENGQADNKVWIGQIQDGKQVVIYRPQ